MDSVTDAVDQDLQMWSFIVSALMPMLVALVQQPEWPRWLRATVTLVACVIAGIVTTMLTDNWDAQDVVTSVLTIFAATLAFHTAFFKPTGITDRIEGITSPGHSGGQPSSSTSSPPEPPLR